MMNDDNLGPNSTLFGLLEIYLHCVITFMISKKLPKIVPGLMSSTLHYKIKDYIKNSVGYWNFLYLICWTLYLDLHLGIYVVFYHLSLSKITLC